jgi:hypothetical protein
VWLLNPAAVSPDVTGWDDLAVAAVECIGFSSGDRACNAWHPCCSLHSTVLFPIESCTVFEHITVHHFWTINWIFAWLSPIPQRRMSTVLLCLWETLLRPWVAFYGIPVVPISLKIIKVFAKCCQLSARYRVCSLGFWWFVELADVSAHTQSLFSEWMMRHKHAAAASDARLKFWSLPRTCSKFRLFFLPQRALTECPKMCVPK